MLYLGLLLCSLLAVTAQGNAPAAPVIQPGVRIAILGDSITEQRLFSRYLDVYLTACMPQLNASVMMFGWSGEMAKGMAARMDNDVMPFKPTMATICYGMNDGCYTAYTPAIGKGYEIPMRDIVTRLKAAGVTSIIGGPGAVDSKYFHNPSASADVYNDNLAHLSEIARTIAAHNGMPFANLHEIMMSAMVQAKGALGDDYSVCGGDGVHPDVNGHIIMTYAFLKAMGCDGDLGTITVDMKGKATAVNGHKVLSYKDGVVEIESTRYPFCFYNYNGSDKSTSSGRSILPFLPFNQDLNRLTLVVTNVDTPQATVTWGTASKVFTREALAKGINLAAEFPDNPFAAPFHTVEGMIYAKEAYELGMVKSIINPTPEIKAFYQNKPEVAAAFADNLKQMLQLEALLQKTAHDAVVPVRHTITIRPLLDK